MDRRIQVSQTCEMQLHWMHNLREMMQEICDPVWRQEERREGFHLPFKSSLCWPAWLSEKRQKVWEIWSHEYSFIWWSEKGMLPHGGRPWNDHWRHPCSQCDTDGNSDSSTVCSCKFSLPQLFQWVVPWLWVWSSQATHLFTYHIQWQWHSMLTYKNVHTLVLFSALRIPTLAKFDFPQLKVWGLLSRRGHKIFPIE